MKERECYWQGRCISKLSRRELEAAFRALAEMHRQAQAAPVEMRVRAYGQVLELWRCEKSRAGAEAPARSC